MAAIEIYKDSPIVPVMVAQAKGERVDSAVADNAAKLIKDLATNPTPHNRYQIGQLIAFSVNEILTPRTNWLDNIADVKRVGEGDKAQFKVKHEGIRAYIQAKGATTARSKIAEKALTLDTVSVSARPVINFVELRNGMQMSELIRDASYQMELAEYGYIQNVLDTAASAWAAPFYGYGSGVVKATIDPMIRYWMRVSGGARPTVLGDIDMVSKLGELTGFTATTNTQWAPNLIDEQNRAGFVGIYNGANVVNLLNPIVEGTANEFIFNRKKLYILPSGIDSAMRPLKVVFEGDVVAQEATNIDDKSYEVRLDQFFGAAMVYGDRPYISVYADAST